VSQVRGYADQKLRNLMIPGCVEPQDSVIVHYVEKPPGSEEMSEESKLGKNVKPSGRRRKEH